MPIGGAGLRRSNKPLARVIRANQDCKNTKYNETDEHVDEMNAREHEVKHKEGRLGLRIPAVSNSNVFEHLSRDKQAAQQHREHEHPLCTKAGTRTERFDTAGQKKRAR